MAVLSDAAKRATYDRDVVGVVVPSEPDLANTFQAMDDLLDEMDGLVERMEQFLSRIKQVTHSLLLRRSYRSRGASDARFLTPAPGIF